MRRILILMLLTIMLPGCANVSRFEKNNLVAFGERLEGSQEPLYYLVRIDVQKSDDARVMSSRLKLSPDSPPLTLEELRPAAVADFLSPFTPPPQWPETWKQKANAEDVYAGNGFHIRFEGGQLLSVGICSHCAGGREQPMVGTPDGQHFYTLPLTEQQVIEVFGAPDRIDKVGEVRY